MSAPRVAVIGLGYVGLPLAVALARHFEVTGYDRDRARVAALLEGHDRTGEVPPERLAGGIAEGRLALSNAPERLAGHQFYLLTVPTPIDRQKAPDLSAVLAACRTLGPVLGEGAIVVLESTVYPGVTEEVVGPALEAASGRRAGHDFFLGYSPERINPGDREHTIERIPKVVAGQTPEIAERIADLYRPVNGGQVFIARDIRTAEAAKAIENAQRDINIAFVNEVAMICQRLGLSVHDVLDAARTKWNFLDFRPGLVGGHCIGVDPFYLAFKAAQLGHHPQILLAGRTVNDAMPEFVAGEVGGRLAEGAEVLVLGLTFKENVPDLRNSKAAKLAFGLQARSLSVRVHDPVADPAEAKALYGLDLLPELSGAGPFDALLGAVAHRAYRSLDAPALARLLRPNGLLADFKGMWRGLALPDGLRRWVL